MKVCHLICNAHLDPIWQWNWEEGAAAAVQTFRSAVNLLEEFDFIFCHNEALIYEWVLKYDPTLFEKIKKLHAEGRWNIMGGWYLQPDCNMPCGEAIVREILEGRRFFDEHFGVRPTVAVNFDSFGHGLGLPQILRKTGFLGYVCCRPWPEQCGIGEDFIWVSPDGSEITVRKDSGAYSSLLGQAANKINGYVDGNQDKDFEGVVFWGVGNHGGGSSRIDLKNIKEIQDKYDNVNIIHSTLENYFASKDVKDYPKYKTSLNHSNAGCLTSQIDLKKKIQTARNELFPRRKDVYGCCHAQPYGISLCQTQRG